MKPDEDTPSVYAQSPLGTAAIRRLLFELLRTDEDLDAFCLDHFPEIHARFSGGMNRIQKTNLLLSLLDDPDHIANLLRAWNASQRASAASCSQLASAKGGASAVQRRSVGRRQVLALVGLGGAAGVAAVAQGLRRQRVVRDDAAPPSRRPMPPTLPELKPRQLSMTAASLESLRREATELCDKALGQRDASLRAQAVDGLGRSGDIRYAAPLIRTLRQDGEPHVRARAALAIGRIGVRSQQGALLDTLRDRTVPEVLAATVEALFRLAEHQSQLVELHKVLRQGLNSPVQMVKLRSAFLLAPLDPAMQKWLWQVVEAHGATSRDPADIAILWRLCQSCFEPATRRIDQLLGDFASEQALATAVLVPCEGWAPALTPPLQWLRARSILAQAVQVTGPHRLAAACALAQLGMRPADATALSWLRELALSPERSDLIRRQAVAGLAYGGDASDLPRLAALLGEQAGPSTALRIEAAATTLRILSTLPSQLDEQALARAEEERATGSGSMLLQSVPSLKALEKVLDWLEHGGEPEDAWRTHELFERLQDLKVDTSAVRRRLDTWLSGQPKKGAAAHRIRAALTEDSRELSTFLQYPDEQVRLWSAERLIRQRQVPHAVVPALQGLRSPQGQIRACGLLRTLNVTSPLPSRRIEAGLRSKSSTERQDTLAALSSWSLADAKPYLEQTVTDPDQSVRRRLLESVEKMVRRQPAAIPTALALAAPLAQDSDSGIQFRYQQIMSYGRPGIGARPIPPPPPPPVLQPPRYVRVSFHGEAGVKFTLDEQELKLPLQLDLPPGAYSLKWLDNDNYKIHRIHIPSVATHQIEITVPLSHQQTPIL